MDDNNKELFEDKDEELFFSEEEVQEEAARWKVLIVDDDAEVHSVTKMVLADFSFNGKKLDFISAYSGKEAKEIMVSSEDVAPLLLDVVMEEEDSGLQAVKYIRKDLGNHFVRIVLRTGQPGQAPEESVILTYDINDYKAKTELTAQKLFKTVVTSLRTYEVIISLEQTRKELIIAKEKAEEMNRVKNIFLSNMNHELRTPLNGIMGFSSILEEQVVDPELKEYVNIIQVSGGRLLTTLNDIMDLVSLEAGQEKLEVREVNVADECQSAIMRHKAAADTKKLSLQFIQDTKNNIAHLDAKVLGKILNNIISNAIKFTLEGDVTLKLVDISKDSESSWIGIQVIDTGVGIDNSFLPKIFDPFHQEDAGYSRSFEGTGIGLTITKQLLDLMGGDIEIQSEKNKGTVVTISMQKNP